MTKNKRDRLHVLVNDLSEIVNLWVESRSLTELPKSVANIYAIHQYVTVSQSGAIDNWVKCRSEHDDPSFRLHLTAKALEAINCVDCPLDSRILEGVVYLAKKAEEEGFDSLEMDGDEIDADSLYSKLSEATYNIGSHSEQATSLPFMDRLLRYVDSHENELKEFFASSPV